MRNSQNFWDKNAGRYDRFMRKDAAAYERLYRLLRPVVRQKTVLELATGTGLIALMLAQRAPGAAVTGIDIDDVGEARANGDASPWGDRLSFVRCPVQEFSDRPFDLIVSNPPFFVDSLTCPDAGRTPVRHAVHLPFGELRDAVVRLLAADGHFAVILPTTEADRFVTLCRGYL